MANESPNDKKARLASEAEKAWAEYRAKQAATDKNTARLRALRLAREAEETPVAAPAPKKKKAKPRA